MKNSKLLRWPLLAISRLLLRPLKSGAPIIRRAAYDSLPLPYFVAGKKEQFVVSTKDRVIGREIFLHGEFDFCKLELALAIIQRRGAPLPTHLVDVGANIGTIVIPAIKRGLMKSATAIEPHPENIRLLRANLAINDVFDEVAILNLAVGSESGVFLHLLESTTNSGNHSVGPQGIPVRSIKLDDLELPPEGSMLWMDIEGYEGHALCGASRFISSGIPIVSEFNPSYLSASGGLEFFRSAMKDRHLFDLKMPDVETDLEALQYRYAHGFTDILAISR